VEIFSGVVKYERFFGSERRAGNGRGQNLQRYHAALHFHVDRAPGTRRLGRDVQDSVHKKAQHGPVSACVLQRVADENVNQLDE
jgi:hypothetical protein